MRVIKFRAKIKAESFKNITGYKGRANDLKM